MSDRKQDENEGAWYSAAQEFWSKPNSFDLNADLRRVFDAGCKKGHASRDEEVAALKEQVAQAREQGRRDVLDALHDLDTLESQEWEQLRAKLRERGEG